MDLAAPRRSTRVAACLLLLLASLVLLHAGSFIRFDDTSGDGDRYFVMPMGVAAVLLALAGGAIAVSDRTARRVFGGALLVLDVLIGVQSVENDGFRFLWNGDEGQLFLFQVALGLAALFLLVPRWMSTAEHTVSKDQPVRRLSGWARVAVYTTALTVTVLVALAAGIAHFEATHCSGPGFDGECDLAALEGFAWALGALLLGIIAIGVSELVAARGRRARRRASAPVDVPG